MSKIEINDSTMIDVLNYSDSTVVLSTHLSPQGYAFDGIRVENEPTIETISFSEIRQANSKTNLFRNGILRFSDKVEEVVYEKLGIKNWREILSPQDIRKIILKPSPTEQDYKKILNITEPADFERVRGELIMLDNTGLYDISSRLKTTITKRYEEIKAGKTRTEIKIDIPTKNKSEDEIRAEIKAENDSQFKQMKDQIAQLMQMLSQQNNDTVQTPVVEPLEEGTSETKVASTRGRKPKTTE